MRLTDNKPAAAVAKCFGNSKPLEFSGDTTILESGDQPQGGFFIETGNVKAISISKSGDERIHTILSQTDIFPLHWLFLGSLPTVSFVAMGPVSLRFASLEHFRRIAAGSPELLTGIIDQVLPAYDRLFTLNMEPAEQRVIHHLMYLAERYGVPASKESDEIVIINLSLTQAVFANMVRLSRETAGRILNDLERQHAVILGRRLIAVSPKKLDALLEH